MQLTVDKCSFALLEMNIEFNFSREDWIAFNVYHISHSPIHQRNRKRAIRAVPLMLIGLVVIQGVYQDEWMVPSIVAVLAAAFWLWWYPSYRDNKVLSGIEQYVDHSDNQAFFGKHSVVLGDYKVSLITATTEKSVGWGDVLRVEFNDAYYFVYDTEQTAIIIPKESISDDKAFMQMLEKQLS